MVRIGEGGEAGAFVDLLRDVVDVRPGEELRVARDDHLVGGRVPVIGSLGSVRIVGDVHRLHAELRGEALHHRQQVDIAVGRLEDDHAIGLDVLHVEPDGDRKSTRLNSSHTVISYAVFCLKKKRKQTDIYTESV